MDEENDYLDDKKIELLQKWGFTFNVKKERWEYKGYKNIWLKVKTLNKMSPASLMGFILRVREQEKNKKTQRGVNENTKHQK